MVIKQLLHTNKSEQEDIIHEIEIVSKFENPNIVTYDYDFWEDETLYLVMEYCQGGSLRDKMDATDINPLEAIEWIKTLASCLRLKINNIYFTLTTDKSKLL